MGVHVFSLHNYVHNQLKSCVYMKKMQVTSGVFHAALSKRFAAYLAIFSCSLSRAVQLEFLSNMETSHFITCFKCLIARRRRPRVIYSDNGGTFIKAGKWLRRLREDERLQGLLDGYDISWKIKVSRAPW